MRDKINALIRFQGNAKFFIMNLKSLILFWIETLIVLIYCLVVIDYEQQRGVRTFRKMVWIECHEPTLKFYVWIWTCRITIRETKNSWNNWLESRKWLCWDSANRERSQTKRIPSEFTIPIEIRIEMRGNRWFEIMMESINQYFSKWTK